MSHDAQTALMQCFGILAAMTLGCMLLAVITACVDRVKARRTTPEQPTKPRIPAQRGGGRRG